MKSSTTLILVMLLVLAAAGWWAFSSSSQDNDLLDPVDSGTSGTQPADAWQDATTTNFSNVDGTDSISLTFTSGQALFTGLGFADVLLTRTSSASGALYESADPSLTIWNQGDQVTISENDTVIFVGSSASDTNDIPAALTDTTWVWEETVMNNGDVTAPADAGAFTLTFTSDGRLSGTTDCNTFSGQYKVVDDSFDVGPLAMTRMACPESQEQEFTSMIDEADRIYFSENGHLVLLLPIDSGSIIFRPASE